ncbi:MAG TPA: hypothetical protein VML55_10185 [Planctomycetaceae bacterium]|nr:hypothetical protein [Planctomycetaceae bacterium]
MDALRYRFEAGCGWSGLLDRLAGLGHRAAIVGPEGSGKTTLQEELARTLSDRGAAVRWLRLRRDSRRDGRRLIRELLAGLGPGDLVFVDGAEQLGALAWRRFVRRTAGCRGLVITTHRPGRLPTLIECRTTPGLLRRLVAELVPDESGRLDAALEDLFARHEGNLRLCLRELYDVWAGGGL